MKLAYFKSELSQVLAKRNGYLVLALASLFVCTLSMFLNFLMFNREKIILVPPAIEKTFWLKGHEVSADYLLQMTQFFASLRLNVTSTSVEHQQELLLQYVDPRTYGALKTQLVREADRIRQQHLTVAFFPEQVQVDVAHKQAVISGEIKSTIGNVALPSARVSYRVSYRLVAGRWLVQAFDEIKHV